MFSKASFYLMFICICVRRCCRPAFEFDSACSRAVAARTLADHQAQRASVHQWEIWLHVQPHATQIWLHPPLTKICRVSPYQSKKDQPYTWGETHARWKWSGYVWLDCSFLKKSCVFCSDFYDYLWVVTVPGSDCSGNPERVQLSKLISSEIICAVLDYEGCSSCKWLSVKGFYPWAINTACMLYFYSE